jgi:hypothetical protein
MAAGPVRACIRARAFVVVHALVDHADVGLDDVARTDLGVAQLKLRVGARRDLATVRVGIREGEGVLIE